MIYRIDPSSGTLNQWTDTFKIYTHTGIVPKCPPRWLQPFNSPLPTPPPHVVTSTFPTAHSLHSSHWPTHPPKVLSVQTLSSQKPSTLHFRPPTPSLWCHLGIPLSTSVLLLPLGVQSCLWVSAEFPRGPQSVLGPQAPLRSFQPTEEAGTEIKERDEGCLE